MRDYEQRAQKFLKQIFPYIESCKTDVDFRRAVDWFNRSYSRKVSFHSGVSRGCFCTSDYVVKFDRKCDRPVIGDCESEMRMYAQAEQDGMEYLFAKISCFSYAGRKWYIMPRINGIDKYKYRYADEFVTEAEADYLCDHVDDMHSGNYGWKNKHIVLVDYACNFTTWGA